MIGFDPLPHSTGTVCGLLRERGFGFIRDDRTKREIIFIRTEVRPIENWPKINRGSRVHYWVSPDRLHPGRFRAIEVSLLDELTPPTGGPPRPAPGELEIRAEAAETLTEPQPGDAYQEEADPSSGEAFAE